MSRTDEVRFCPMCGREQPSRTFVHAGNDWVCAECAEELAENKRRLKEWRSMFKRPFYLNTTEIYRR
jgi:ribosomal protein L37AE/L43A